MVHQRQRVVGGDADWAAAKAPGEAGVLHQINDKLTVAGGVGFGIGEDSPDVRITVGFQYSF